MENKLDITKIMLILFIWTIVFYLLGYLCGWIFNKNDNSITHQPIVPSTIIDSTERKLDSIKYNIIYRDTIIYRIKEEMINEVNEVKHLNDSSSIIEFKKLVTEP